MLVEVRIGGTDRDLRLLPSRAVYDPVSGTVYVADLHLGKGTVFRRAGVPVPSGSAGDDLDRLEATLDDTGAGRLVVLGDLVHGPTARVAEFDRRARAWLEGQNDLEVVLVEGNHDRSAGAFAATWGLRTVAEGIADGPFVLRHAPVADDLRPTLAGHVHPVVRLREGRGARLRAPCFWLRGSTLVLPAFATFAGGQPVRPRSGDRIFAVGPDAVLEVPVPSTVDPP